MGIIHHCQVMLLEKNLNRAGIYPVKSNLPLVGCTHVFCMAHLFIVKICNPCYPIVPHSVKSSRLQHSQSQCIPTSLRVSMVVVMTTTQLYVIVRKSVKQARLHFKQKYCCILLRCIFLFYIKNCHDLAAGVKQQCPPHFTSISSVRTTNNNN